MPNSWGIEIGILNGMVAFRPNVPGAQVGQPLGVAQNDLVHWINRTPLTIVLLSSQPPECFWLNPSRLAKDRARSLWPVIRWPMRR